MKFYEKKILKLKFDGMMRFFGDIGTNEVLKNEEYFKVKEANQLAVCGNEEVLFVENLWTHLRETGVSKCILTSSLKNFG